MNYKEFNFIIIVLNIVLIFSILYQVKHFIKLVHNEEFEQKTSITSTNDFTKKLPRKSPPIPDYKKYIIFEQGYNGWADRVKGIVTTYALAQLTNRVFLIHMTEPCNITDYLLPNEINWNQNINELIENGKLPKNFTSLKYLNQNYGKYKAYNMTDVYEIIVYYKNIDVIYFSINDNWLFYFSGETIFHNKVRQLGYEPPQFEISFVLKSWLAKLFKFSPKLQEEYNKYLPLLKPNKNTTLICTQIRTHDDKSKKNSSVAVLYWDFIKKHYIKNLNTDYRIFVTSDFNKIEIETQQHFGKDKVVFTTNYDQNDSVHFLLIKSCDKEIKFILDFFILSNCDLALIGYGEYGKTALYNRDYPKSNNFNYMNQSMPTDFYLNMLGAVGPKLN